VKDCDPTTGEPDSDRGYEDDYVVRVFSFSVLKVLLNCLFENKLKRIVDYLKTND